MKTMAHGLIMSVLPDNGDTVISFETSDVNALVVTTSGLIDILEMLQSVITSSKELDKRNAVC